MTPERWQEIDNLLMKVIERPLEERTALLDQVCSNDKTLRLEVESLITFREKARGFLEVSAFEDAACLLVDDEPHSAPQLVIDRYRIEGFLGAGGMGDVYLAEDTNLDIKVAIKFLSPYLEEDQVAKQRLIREAKAAAKLDHPNICSVYEVKEEANRSFIVMQYVPGKTLADRNKDGRMGINEALELTIQVVEALAEAHSRGIVHRDIKPGNIMITERRQVKVLDFGLAKVMSPTSIEYREAKSDYLLSRPGERAGTPPYMAPEQVKGTTVDARCDLFAVGVVLYECLTGERPFCGKTDNEILSQVIQFDPLPPSKLNTKVIPKLDSIVLKALAKDANTRHQTAEELLGDLRALQYQSWLSALAPALLKPRVYVPVSLFVLGVALLSSFIWSRLHAPYRPAPEAARWYNAGTAELRNGAYFEASKSLQKAVAADDRFALGHARLAEAYTELDYSDKAKDEIIRAESLANELRIQQQDALYLKAVTNTVLRDFPVVVESYQQIAHQTPDNEKANVYLDLGRAYEKNDQSAKAKENYEEATKLAPQEPATFLRLGVVCGQLQDFACASASFERALSIYQALGNQEGVTEVFYQRGFLLLDQVKLAEARVQLENALQMTNSTRNLYQQIKVLQGLSNTAALEGHIDQAKQKATEAIQLARDNGIENQVTSGLIWLGNALLLRGDYSDAEKYYQQGLELAQRDKMRLNEAWARRQLGSLRSAQHKNEEALSYIEQALAFYEQGPYHHWISLCLISLGRIHRDKGDYEAALKTFEKLVQLGNQLGDQLQVGLAHVDIGNVLLSQEQYPDALQQFDKGYDIFKSLKAEVYMAYAAESRASVLWQLGDFGETKTALDEATSVAERAEEPEDTYKELLAEIHLTDAHLELSNWHLDEAKVKSQKALDLATDQYPVISIQAKNVLALAQARAGAMGSPKLLCKDAISTATNTNDPQLINSALLSCSEALLDGGETQRALETALRAQESFARFGKEDSEWRAWSLAAQASKQLGKEGAASEYASYAEERLLDLEQKWGSEAYNGYLTRSDITHFRKQLDRLLKP